MKVLVKYHDNELESESFGNWIDLRCLEDVELKRGENKLIKLNVSIKLPKHFQANIVPRSSTMKYFKIIQANHYGVVDGPDKYSNGYSGDNDIWMFHAIALEDTYIKRGDRICQFEIRPTMNMPFWYKIKWLFSSGFKFIVVDHLDGEDRGGFGKSGKN